jgi:hypothetical protein
MTKIEPRAERGTWYTWILGRGGSGGFFLCGNFEGDVPANGFNLVLPYVYCK